MMNDDEAMEVSGPAQELAPAAKRALDEAAARSAKATDPRRPPEFAGRDGPEPVRYGDWEVKGLATDF